jgi:GNAT superfamily N-acetyltransferase
MNQADRIEITALSLSDAHQLAPLIAAYAQDINRGAPRRPDDYYAEMLLQDRATHLIGARLGQRLVGFAVFFDLPDTTTGLRTGQLDELFVLQDVRGRGVGRALIAAVVEEGKRRGWTRVRWLIPEKARVRQHLLDAFAESAGLRAYAIPIDRKSDN